MLKIPVDTLFPIAIEVRRRLLSDPDKWSDYEIESIRARCGNEFAHVPVLDLRCQLIGLRKKGKLGRVRKGGHGATKLPESPTWYQEYLRSDEWQSKREMFIDYWRGRCAICNGDGSEVHHNNYDCLHNEKICDCILVCRKCHKMIHVALTKRRNRETAPTLF